MPNHKFPKVTENVSPAFNKICTILADICHQKLNQQYFDLCLELALKLARKRPSPLLGGNPKTWAAGIVHALGLINFLFDKSQTPHVSSKDLCTWFGLGQSTISGKSKTIRDMFKIHQMDPKWCLPSKLMDNPFIWLAEYNGVIVDVRRLPQHMQLDAYHAGVIPFLPNQK